MAVNPYTYHGPGERWSLQQATAQDRMNVARENADYLYTALSEIIDLDDADGLNCHVDAPLHLVVATDTVWSFGWWQAEDTTWWWLAVADDVESFERADADFYIPTGDINDVPAS